MAELEPDQDPYENNGEPDHGNVAFGDLNFEESLAMSPDGTELFQRQQDDSCPRQGTAALVGMLQYMHDENYSLNSGELSHFQDPHYPFDGPVDGLESLEQSSGRHGLYGVDPGNATSATSGSLNHVRNDTGFPQGPSPQGLSTISTYELVRGTGASWPSTGSGFPSNQLEVQLEEGDLGQPSTLILGDWAIDRYSHNPLTIHPNIGGLPVAPNLGYLSVPGSAIIPQSLSSSGSRAQSLRGARPRRPASNNSLAARSSRSHRASGSQRRSQQGSSTQFVYQGIHMHFDGNRYSYYCGPCGRRRDFSDRRGCTRHRETHGPHRFACSACHYNSCRRDNTERHIQIMLDNGNHTAEPYPMVIDV